MLLKILAVSTILINVAQLTPIPQNDKSLFDDGPEDRRHKKKRPCRGRTPDGRTFFDWNLQYLDVNYNHNYNYNINCGGLLGQQGGGHKPGGNFQKPGLGGDNHRPGLGGNKPLLSGLTQGGNQNPGGLLNGPLNFVQSQVQGILSNPPNVGSLIPQDGIFNGGGLGSLLQGGLFNGQGISSLFQNGLFSGIFDNNRPVNNYAPPVRPPINNVPARPPPVVTTPKPDVQDPDDIIYNDEKPVYEDHDDVVLDQYNRPGQYPVFGSLSHDLNGFNFNRKYRQFNREINRFVSAFGF